MEHTNIMERTAPSDEVQTAPSETEYALNIALVYQDPPARKWASQVCDQVTQLAGKDAVRCSWWDISRLSDPKVLQDAIQTATLADVILVSMSGAKELPVDFCVWIDAWLPRRRLPTGALIALIGVSGQLGVQPDRAQVYLRAVARKGRLDFLLRERSLPAASRGYFFMEKTTDRNDPAASVVQEALGNEHKNLRH